MGTHILLPALLAALLLSTGAGDPPPGDAGATFVVVRHAEKTSDSERDPALSGAGLARAQALADRLADDDLVAVYTSGYRRTRQTVQPSAAAHGLDATTYDAKVSADAFTTQLKAAHRRGTVLVAGHSNTVPGIVAALCACDVEPMPEAEYDRISTIHVDADGRARLQVARFGATAHAP